MCLIGNGKTIDKKPFTTESPPFFPIILNAAAKAIIISQISRPRSAIGNTGLNA